MESPQKDYYEILGVSKDATPDEIRKAYKKLAIKWHPDKHVDDKKEAEEKFKEIAGAYSVLSDPEKKREYDTGGMDFGFDDFDNLDPFAMFEDFFGKIHGKHGGFEISDLASMMMKMIFSEEALDLAKALDLKMISDLVMISVELERVLKKRLK